MRIILASVLLFGGVILAQAQDIERSVIAAAGESASSSTSQLDITIGEIVTLTSTSTSSSHVTQGFHQSVSTGNVSIKTIEKPTFTVLAYPNPVRDQLTIETSLNSGSLTYTIVNLHGTTVSSGEVYATHDVIKTDDLSSAPYILILQDQEKGIKQSIRFNKM